jgi:TRAP-type mannitol/chloroaromatic compound transport system permease small subunit
MVIINAISESVGKIVSFLFLPMIGILSYEVAARYIFNAPTIWAHETSAFLFGITFMLGGAYTLRKREHVNVDIIYGRFGKLGQAILDIATFPFFFIFVGLMLWTGAVAALDSIRFWERSNSIFALPIWPIKLIIVVAALLMLLQGITKFIQDLAIVSKGRQSS